jgi:hypothetical protein
MSTDTFVNELINNLAQNLAQSVGTQYAARHGNVFQGAERVCVAKSGSFARKIAYALNQQQQTRAFVKAMEAVILKSSGDPANLAAVRRAIEGEPKEGDRNS